MPVPFLWCGGSWFGCVVVPVMGALFQSRGWLPIEEAPGYSRYPTSILAMQLLIIIIIIIIIIFLFKRNQSISSDDVDMYSEVIIYLN